MEIKINGIYKHFKGNKYKVLCIAYDSETLDELVIYQALYADMKIYARKKDNFLSKVDRNKYPNVSQEYRFQLEEGE